MEENNSNSIDTEYQYSITALQKIKNYKINPKSIPFVLDFTLLWSLFEATLMPNGKSLSLKIVFEKINQVKLIANDDELINSLYNKISHFERGSHNQGILAIDDINSHRVDLRINYDIKIYEKNTYIKTKIDNYLSLFEKEEKTSHEKFRLILFLAYRVRNNLFHGSKDLNDLWDQKSLFEIINPILAKAIIYFNKKI